MSILENVNFDSKTPDFFNRRSNFYLLAFACSLLAVIIISDIIRFRSKPENISKRLENYIRQSSDQLKINTDLILSKLTNEESFSNFLNNHFTGYFEKEGQLFLIYKNGRLAYWTDNSFPAPAEFDSLLFSKMIMNEGNGWFLSNVRFSGNTVVAGLQLLKYSYKYSNDYLPGSFFGKFSLPLNTNILLSKNRAPEKIYEIKSPEGELLFYISFNEMPRPGPVSVTLLFVFTTLSLIFLIAFIFALYRALFSAFKTNWLLLGFYLDVIIVRALQFYFRFPSALYDSDLFSPVYYASSGILPSLGDLFLNVILILQVAWFTYRGLGHHKPNPLKNKTLRYFVLAMGIIVITIIYYLSNTFIQSLVVNSNIHLGFDGLFNISLLSVTGFSLIASILFAFLFFFYSISIWIIRAGISYREYLYAGIGASAIYLIYCIYSNDYTLLHAIILAIIYIAFYIQHSGQERISVKLSQTFLFVFLFAVLANYSLNLYNRHIELEKRKLMALHLTEYRNSMAEYKFGKISNEILLDNELIKEIRGIQQNPATEDKVIRYLLNNHFNGYWSKFRLQITLCYPGKKLEIKPNNTIVECCNYFDDLILNHGKQTSVSGLYFFDNAIDMMYYTGRITLEPSLTELRMPVFIYVEIISKNNYFAVGYPQLLLEKSSSEPENLFDYSYAIYQNRELAKSAGKYPYDLHEINKFSTSNGNSNFNYNGYNHQFFPINQFTQLVISHRNLTLSESIAPFSYIFIFLSVFMLFFHVISGKSLIIRKEDLTFKLRLQVAIVGIILVSSLVIGTVTILNIVRLNETKNMETVTEKINSVRYELELLLSEYQKITPDDENMLADALDRIADALFIDVNLYDAEGGLLATSRKQIFDDKLLSTQINPVSRFNVINNHKSFYSHTETIGQYKFLSAYATIRNYDNKVIGIINLPYFSRQTEQKQELYDFLATFANTLIILIALAIFLALFISKYVTKPLQLIGSKLGNLQLGRSNAKIEWSGKDEIGSLVSEYNRMIDELGQKAELLAQSERESAWRQMARQVAHEIKNPLTPIKLSIQHLMRAWNDKAPDWEQRLNKFSQTLIMQIDTLSEIAAEFSDFAQMPEPVMQRFDMVPMLNHSISLFGNFANISISFETTAEKCFVNADENQMLRVFNNLIKNAVQAIPIGREGHIAITLNVLQGNCRIAVADDGSGILPEQQNRIFSPNFTTKSAGMGLGLAMVKNIIDISGGRIWFDSEPDKGTTFTVELPLAAE